MNTKQKIAILVFNIYTYNEIETGCLKVFTVKPNEQKFRDTRMFIIIRKQ